MTNAILRGKPDAGNPHVRFDEGEVASAKPRRGSLLYKNVTTENLRRGNRAEPRLRWRVLASLFAMCSVGSAVSAADLTVDGRAVETRDDSAYPRIGTLAPRCAPDPNDNQWMIGCEVLDRDFTRFAAYKDYLPKLGIRSIRLQGGWAKCEKEKG